MLFSRKYHNDGVFQTLGPNLLVSYEIDLFAMISILKKEIEKQECNALLKGVILRIFYFSCVCTVKYVLLWDVVRKK